MTEMIGFRRNLFRSNPMIRGEDVLAVQQALVRRNARLLQDGLFGDATLAAVRAFQTGAGLVPDGIVGPATWAALFSGQASAARTNDATARHCFDMLAGKNWGSEQACGIIANLARESRFDPNAVGDGGQAHGIAQWHPDRQAAFASFKGRNIVGSTLDDQLDFVHFELTEGQEQRAGKRLRAARTAREAGEIVSRYYERPGAADAEAQIRGAAAQAYFDSFQASGPAQPLPGNAPSPSRLAGDVVGAERLKGLLRPHRLFKDSPSWAVSEAGVEFSGSLAVSVSAADRDAVQKVYETQRAMLVSALAQGHVPLELALAVLCAAAPTDGTARLTAGADLINPNRTPDCVTAGVMQTTLSLARTALGHPALTVADLQAPDVAIRAGVAVLWLQAQETRFDPPLVAAMYSAGSLRYDPRGRWRLFEPTPSVIDRFVRFFNAAMQVVNVLSVPPQVASFHRMFEASASLSVGTPDAEGRYVAANPQAWIGALPVDTGQCVALVRKATGAPPSSTWRRGERVQGMTLAAGTAIATFDADGHYGNHEDGSSHAALYLDQDSRGIDVVDQWKGQAPHRRTLAFNRPNATKANRGEEFFVVI